jgi:hypothetical protein
MRVAILLVKGAFRDFQTVDERLNVEPPKERIVRIEWHPDFIDKPVYERGDGHIWSARTLVRPTRVSVQQAFELDFRPSPTTPSVRRFSTLVTEVTTSTTSTTLRQTQEPTAKAHTLAILLELSSSSFSVSSR